VRRFRGGMCRRCAVVGGRSRRRRLLIWMSFCLFVERNCECKC
jgi:hypothetical protein